MFDFENLKFIKKPKSLTRVFVNFQKKPNLILPLVEEDTVKYTTIEALEIRFDTTLLF